MAQKRYTRGRNNNSNNDLTGIVLIIISAFFLLCLCIPVLLGAISKVIRHVTVGIFGFMAYPIFLCMLLLGIAIVQKRKLSVAPKTVVSICLIAFFASIILQLATSYKYLGSGFNSYIKSVYDNFTGGGVFFAVFAYGLQSIITPIFTYIVCSLLILLIGGFMLKDKLLVAPRREEYAEPHRNEFQKGVNPPVRVQRLSDQSLFVDIIRPTEGRYSSASGTFGELRDMRNDGNMQSYSTPVSPQGRDEQDGSFIPYGTDISSNSDKKEKAKQILYGDANLRPIFPDPTVEPESPKQRPDIPQSVYAEPDVKQSAPPKEPERQKPEKVLHIEDYPQLSEIHVPPPKDISNSYVGGFIINGDERSQELAEKNGFPKKNENKFGMDLTRNSDFNTHKYEPMQIEPKNNYNFGSEPKIPTPPVEPAPIINGDYVGKKQPQEQPLNTESVSQAPMTDEKLSAKYEEAFEAKEETQRSIVDKSYQSNSTEAIDDDVVDLSEYSFANDNDTTGMYNPVAGSGSDIGGLGSLEFVIGGDEKTRSRSSKKKSSLDNQITFDGYTKDITQNIPSKPKKRRQHYNPPPISLLSSVVNNPDDIEEDYTAKANLLESTLHDLKLPVTVKGITKGPAVTRYELEMPPGIPVKRITNFAQDIEYSLEVNGHIRLETPIPGKRAVGVEVPNTIVDVVSLRDVIDTKEFASASSPLTVAMGKDIAGTNIFCALDKMPHLLVAGATNAGKSVCLSSIIISLLYKSSPEDVRIILIDPKTVEFTAYRNMPHLLGGKIITDAKESLNALKYLRAQMEERYKMFSKNAVRNIQEFNKLESVKNGEEEKMPYIVLIVDELADLLMSTDINKKDLESNIQSLAQKARAAGIHLILATQRPSVDVITGTIKANLPSRIAFAVRSSVDSGVILDQAGAETLLGRGDMLYAPAGMDEPKRVQGAFLTNEEISAVVDYVCTNNEADFDEEFINSLTIVEEAAAATNGGSNDGDDLDPLMKGVLKLIIQTGMASVTFIQRRFAVGYARAARIMDQMETNKFVSPSDASNKRQIYITKEQFIEMYGEEAWEEA